MRGNYTPISLGAGEPCCKLARFVDNGFPAAPRGFGAGVICIADVLSPAIRQSIIYLCSGAVRLTQSAYIYVALDLVRKYRNGRWLGVDDKWKNDVILNV
ncbi:hypothetical protein EVAR_12745_1 [Eumeta japonica]|uniref:Uncharacterized protein n=1 Tax=Eumeta variegata TaxID=151549 RepID=A0A4C1UMP0_EUMVA|nr:hypothetical protein EVAR_12745_1 [Eumeta japonica]